MGSDYLRRRVVEENTCNDPVPQVIVVRDSERIKILMDETRRKILEIMRIGHFRKDGTKVEDWSVKELAKALGSSPQRIYHHIDKLVEHGFVVKCREEKKVRSVVSYYKRAARSFAIEYEEGNQAARGIYMSRGAELVEKLREYFDISLTEEDEKKFLNMMTKIWSSQIKYRTRLRQRLKGNIDDGDSEIIIQLLSSILAVNVEDYEKFLREANDLIKPAFGL